MNKEKVYLLAMQQIESRLRDFLHANSFFIPDSLSINGKIEVVQLSELQDLIEKLFEDVKG